MTQSYQYPQLSPLSTGLAGRCPRCGQGRLFSGYLTPAKTCQSCQYDLAKLDSGDGPAVIIILLVGFIVLAAVLVVEVAYEPAYWVHAVLWLPLIIGLPLILLRPMKGLFLTSQYRAKAHEGRLDDGV